MRAHLLEEVQHLGEVVEMSKGKAMELSGLRGVFVERDKELRRAAKEVRYVRAERDAERAEWEGLHTRLKVVEEERDGAREESTHRLMRMDQF